MKVLITGANGLLGQKLVALLTGNGIATIATSRGEDKICVDEDYHYESLDITDKEEVSYVLEKNSPDVVINTAAMTQVDLCEYERDACWQINVEGVRHLMQACAEINAFFIQLSTDFIFDGRSGPYHERDKPKPLNYYGESKLAAEKLLYESRVSWAIARTILVYGYAPYMSRSNLVLWVRESLSRHKEIQVVDDQWRTPTLVEDLAFGCFLIAQKKAEGIFHIGGAEMLSPYQMALATAEHFGLNKELVVKTNSQVFKQAAKRPPKTGLVIQKAEEELGYHSHSFKEGLRILSGQLSDNK